MILGQSRPFVIGKQGYALFRAHVGEDDARGFPARISGVAYFVFERAPRRFRRRVEHVSFDVVFPAVVNAGQAAFFIAAKEERSAAMRAMLGQKSDASVTVAKRNQVFSEKTNSSRRAIRG